MNSWHSRITLHSPATFGACCFMFVAAKAVSLWIVAIVASSEGGEPLHAAWVALLCLLPASLLEAGALVTGFRLARCFMVGPSLGVQVQIHARNLGALLYLCFIASCIGLFATGWILDLGMAVAAPVLAPLAPVAVASGALRLLAKSVHQGAQYESEVQATI
jgi:hypothetical protein